MMTTATQPDAVTPPASEEALRAKAHALIPGGAHTYAKGDDQYPVNAPAFIARGEGCRVYDLSGRAFIEYGAGLRAVTLGHAHPAVIAAVAEELARGTNFVRPSPLEVEAAEAVLACIPGADMIKFAKNASDATTAAVRLARAATGRDLVAICSDHPFFSTDDWFIGASAMPAGIPAAIRDLTKGFRYNDLPGLERLLAAYPGQVAAVVLEPETSTPPAPGYLAGLRQLCDRNGVVLIFDETITGFRWHLGGAQTLYGVRPHLSVFGKALANGFALAALVGERDLMERGGIDRPGERVFLLSTTAGAESVGLRAGIATLEVYRREPVIATLHAVGDRLRDGLTRLAERHGVGAHFEVIGRACNLVFVTKDAAGNRCQNMRTLFMQEMIKGGVIGPSFVVNYGHDAEAVERTLTAADQALGVYAAALMDGPSRFLEGRPVRPVFRPTN